MGAGEVGRGPLTHVWYTSYGSNMHAARLASYITGGRPPGAAREYPGCRDRELPTRVEPVELPGVVYFATQSPVWGGGRAFYDRAAQGRVLARAHLVTVRQFSDIAAQEMYRSPGPDLDLTEVLSDGRSVLGPGRYETLECPGVLDGHPLLTFTAPWAVADVPGNAPSPAYVAHLLAGLLEADAWPADEIAAYLATRPGAAPHWTPETVRALRPADPGGGGAGVRGTEGGW